MFNRPRPGDMPSRHRVVVDCSKDEIIVEQSHAKEVDINNIIKKHGIDLIAKTNLLQSQDFRFDDVTGNDFQEALFKIKKAESSFNAMPSNLRKQFNNNPAEFLDFVQNPDNASALVEMGLANAPKPAPAPVQVEIVAQPPITETPPA